VRRAYLGLDCGTQSTKAVLLDGETGDEIASRSADHELIARPDGTREQEPTWWLDAATSAARGALDQALAVEVQGIAVSGQQHGLVALDAGGRPVRPAKLWNDTSTVADCVALTNAMGGETAVHAATGNVFMTGYTAPKIAWLRRSEPDAYDRAVRFCLPHDWLNLWLTGEFGTEAGDASGTAYFDIRTRTYAPGVLAAIDDHRNWETSLPPVIASDQVLGRLRPAAADALGLPAGIPVATGGGDNMCAAIGVGAVVPGIVVMSLGTSGTIFGQSLAPAVDPLREVSAFCDSTGQWLPLACVLNCTLPLEWVHRLLGLDYAGFDRLVESAAPGASGLRFVPYMDGERTPNRPNAASEFQGLRAEHGQAEIARAVLEGVTAGLAHALRAFRRTGTAADSLLLVGGGARSSIWAQLLADWVDLPIARPSVVEAAARGAAIQVAHVVGGLQLRRPVVIDAHWEPRHETAIAELAALYASTLENLSSR